METNRSGGGQRYQNPEGTLISNQLAEYRKKQAERYKQQNVSEDHNNSVNISRDDHEQPRNQVFPEMVRLPNPQQPAARDQPHDRIDLDYELAKRLQEEELLESERNVDNYNQNDNQYNNQPRIPNYDDGIRQADNYREERLIPDANDEEVRRQEFIRQQQLLYSQYQNPGIRQNNQNDMERNFNGANAPLLQRRSIHHLQIPVVGRVNREVCNWVCLGFLFSALITTMILILLFAK